MKNKFNRKNKFNETKLAILSCISYSKKPLNAAEIANNCGLSLYAVQSCLWRLWRWGYIFRRKDKRKHGKKYTYRCLKDKGFRVLREFERRERIEKALGISISLNLKEPVP